MAQTVIELSHRDLFCLQPDMPAAAALDHLRRLELHGAPVVDDAGRPIGVVTMMDLVGDLSDITVSARMTQPVDVVPGRAAVAEVARSMAHSGRHHVVVVDGETAVGFVSAVDMLAAVLGLSPRRPPGFPHGVGPQGVRWSEPVDFAAQAVERAPASGGLLILIHGGAFRPERVVWVESADDMRARLVRLADTPASRPEDLARWFGWGTLRYCVSAIDDVDARSRALGAVHRWREAASEAVVHSLLGHQRIDE